MRRRLDDIEFVGVNRPIRQRRPRQRLSQIKRPTLAERSNLGQNQMYYWIWAQKKDGGYGLYGGGVTREEATRLAYDRCKGCPDWEVVGLPTRNQATATQIMKARRFQQNPDITFDGAFERVAHK